MIYPIKKGLFLSQLATFELWTVSSLNCISLRNSGMLAANCHIALSLSTPIISFDFGNVIQYVVVVPRILVPGWRRFSYFGYNSVPILTNLLLPSATTN